VKRFRVGLAADGSAITGITDVQGVTVAGATDCSATAAASWSSRAVRPRVVNADFATSTKPFTVAGLPRRGG
jgi:hypothetical protein